MPEKVSLEAAEPVQPGAVRFGGPHAFRVSVKPDKRHGFREWEVTVYANGLRGARDHAAFLHDVPRRWVRAVRVSRSGARPGQRGRGGAGQETGGAA
jgi:hypothetical protein